jgi:hypothetical protein
MGCHPNAGYLLDQRGFIEFRVGLVGNDGVDFVLTHPKELQGVLFNMWDGKTYDHIIWKQLKPEFMKL